MHRGDGDAQGVYYIPAGWCAHGGRAPRVGMACFADGAGVNAVAARGGVVHLCVPAVWVVQCVFSCIGRVCRVYSV